MSSDIMPFMTKHIVHISEAEATSDFAGRAGARARWVQRVVIGERGALPVAVVRPAEPHVQAAFRVSSSRQRAWFQGYARRGLRARSGSGDQQPS
jgi:hypothetical protein